VKKRKMYERLVAEWAEAVQDGEQNMDSYRNPTACDLLLGFAAVCETIEALRRTVDEVLPHAVERQRRRRGNARCEQQEAPAK
jgi:hypothetical protein